MGLFSKEKTSLEKIIGAVEAEMLQKPVESAEYKQLIEHLAKLYEIKGCEDPPRRDPIKYDTILIVAGSVLTSLALMAYEQKHVISGKAWSQVIRPKTPLIQ